MSEPNSPLLAYLLQTLATGVQTVSTNASFGISVCGFRGRTSVLKQEWILNCTTPTRVPERDLKGVILTKSHLVCCRGNLEFIPNSKVRTKYAEPVLFTICSRTIPNYQHYPPWTTQRSFILPSTHNYSNSAPVFVSCNLALI